MDAGVAVSTEPLLRVRVRRAAAVDREHDRTLADPTGLALHLCEALSVIDHEVVPRVLSERNEEVVSARAEREHDRQCGAIADELRVLHLDSVTACGLGRAVSKLDNEGAATMSAVPE
jgi:hypothetical protein